MTIGRAIDILKPGNSTRSPKEYEEARQMAVIALTIVNAQPSVANVLYAEMQHMKSLQLAQGGITNT